MRTLALTNTKGRIFNSHDIIKFTFLKNHSGSIISNCIFSKTLHYTASYSQLHNSPFQIIAYSE